MPAVQFNRDAQARWYAEQHIQTDSGVSAIHYLPTNAPEREIRLLEINDQMSEPPDDLLEPVDFGVDRGSSEAHSLVVLDVTPAQWSSIKQGKLPLPGGWSLNGSKLIAQRP